MTRIAELIVVVALAVYYFTESFILTLAPSFLIPEKDISGKIALVTGGAGGVGKELVLRLAKHKLTVIVWDNNSKGKLAFFELEESSTAPWLRKFTLKS